MFLMTFLLSSGAALTLILSKEVWLYVFDLASKKELLLPSDRSASKNRKVSVFVRVRPIDEGGDR